MITIKIKKFLTESNKIERESSQEAHEDAFKAWNYLKKQKELTPDVILKTHEILMKRLRPDIAGKWRNCDVMIGGQRKCFISEALIKEDVLNFCIQLLTSSSCFEKDKNNEMRKIEITVYSHIDFENLHPFEDGNGRVGRLIYLWHREKLGLPVHIIHADWEIKGRDGDQWNYYQWFGK